MHIFRISLLLLFMGTSTILPAQETVSNLHFQLTYDGSPLALGKQYYSPTSADSVKFSTVRFYLSDLTFYHDDQLITALEKKYLLVDAAVPASQTISWSNKTVLKANRLRFNLGIDSLTNAAGAMGGDLDPVNGMYWSWQSGYINVKIEGSSPVCPSRNQRFQFHLGGYQAPYNNLQEIMLFVDETPDLTIEIPIDKLLSRINLSEVYQIMSPGQKAIELAALFSSTFTPKL